MSFLILQWIIWDLKADSPASWSHISGSYSTSSCESETGDSAAQCSFLLLTMIRKDPICVKNGGEKKKTKTSRLSLTCWFLLQKLSQDEPTASDPTAQETNDQPAESEAPPPAGTNRPVDVYDQQVVLVHVMYGMFLSLRWRQSHAVVKKLLRGLLSSYSLRADEERPQETIRQFQVFRFIYNRFCDDVKGVNKLKRVPRGLKSRFHRLCQVLEHLI